ncbi:MAG: Rpn family recombination-promoting nuclease/putative transposase [Acetatifactor sp.]|nr:Rpn family recombination-promoting nuclease/putative transposase [Acetatifactor sp.]
MGIVSPKYDFSFKQLMQNEEVRKYFISDVLGIPAAEIRSVRLASPFLWKRYSGQKQGILDVRVELNDDRMVNIELQIKMLACWDKRSLFYLAKMFTEELLVGEQYHRLKKCICINLLDFNLDEDPEYHRIYRLRNEKGQEYSDLFEMHVIELGKKLKGTEPVDEWIRLMNVRTEEELEMISAKNPGLLEAVKEVKVMSLRKGLRALYEAHLREIRDRNARDAFVREEGRAEGKEEGRAEGKAEGMEVGKAAGKADDVLQLLNVRGVVPKELEQIIRAQRDLEILSDWHLTAARAESVDAFLTKTGIQIPDRR